MKPEEDPGIEIIISPASKSTTPTPSELREDDADDEFDEDDDEFSFHKFSFQSDSTHEHITQRIMKPLLPHDDEGDTLVRAQRVQENFVGPKIIFLSPNLTPLSSSCALQACLTVFWIILRYMGDMPEPKSLDAMSQASSTLSSPLPNRRGRRLSSLVGLDQVTKSH